MTMVNRCLPGKIKRSGLGLLFLTCLSGAVSCGGVRFSAKAVESEGVRIIMTRGSASSRTADFRLRVHNNTSEPLAIDGSQIAVIGPDGVPRYSTVRRRPVFVAAGSSGVVRVTVRDKGARFNFMPGAYLRLDGVFLGGRQLFLPAVVVGSPVGEPGATPGVQPSADVLALLRGEPPSSRGRRPTRRTRNPEPDVGQVSAGPSVALAAPRGPGPQVYRGMRRRISQSIKCAVLPVRPDRQVDKDELFVLDELLLTEAQRAGFEAMGPADISAIIGFEKMKDEAGCDNASCMAEIGNALGVKYLIRGSVARLGAGTMFSVNLLNVEDATVVARSSRISQGGKSDAPRLVAEAVQELVGASNL